MTYDEIGNILTKSDVGTYTYGTTTNGPHVVQSIITNTGSILNTTTQNITYTSFDKVHTIWQGVDSMAFTYGAGHERKRVDTYQNHILKSQKYYVGNLYEREKVIATGEIKETHYIFAAGGAVAIYSRSSTGATNIRYLHKDHLGSMQCIIDETGHLVQELSYDAWGNRRDVATWAVYTTLPTGILLARGFTGHEHLDLFDLINMDGRVYDPVLGRFLSPDPIIQNPENLQSLNRYTYCLNNPLSLTDPSGYSWLSDNWRSLAAAAMAITVSTITAGFGSGFGYAIFVGAVGGFTGGVTGALLEGANIGQAFKAGAIGALIGGISAGVANKVGSLFDEGVKLNFDDLLGKMLSHGITQGGISELSGGKFSQGFFSAALSAGLAGAISKDDGTLKVGRGVAVAASAVVGGSASVLGGGKFANGAITGAYVMLFNALMHSEKGDPQSGNNTKSGGVPPTGDKFYSVDGSLLWNENIQGEENQVFVVSIKKYQTLEDIKNAYDGRPDLLDRRLRQLSEEYEFFTPNIKSNVLCVFKSQSIWKYATMTLSVMGEGYVYGHQTIPFNNKYSVANYWANDFGVSKFQKWW